MDERQLSELFRDAAEGGPPASFGHADVVARSRRITTRRRMAAAGSALGLVVVLGGGFIVGSDLLRGGDSGTGQATSAGVTEQQREAAPYDQALPPTLAPEKGDVAAVPDSSRASGKVVPFPGLRDDGVRTPCGPPDPDLAAALASEIPASTRPTAVPDACPPGARSAAIPVPGGSLYVVLAPSDASIDAPLRRSDGAIGHAVRTPKGQVLVVVGVPAVDGGTAPHADRLPSIATKIAQRY